MLMPPWRKADLIAFCRLGELSPEEIGLLEALYDAAVGYMTQAGVRDPNYGEYGLRCERAPRKALYDLCVNYLVLDSWDRRDVSITGTIVADNPAFRRLLNQLKLTEPDWPTAANQQSVCGEDTSGPGEGKPS